MPSAKYGRQACALSKLKAAYITSDSLLFGRLASTGVVTELLVPNTDAVTGNDCVKRVSEPNVSGVGAETSELGCSPAGNDGLVVVVDAVVVDAVVVDAVVVDTISGGLMLVVGNEGLRECMKTPGYSVDERGVYG